MGLASIPTRRTGIRLCLLCILGVSKSGSEDYIHISGSEDCTHLCAPCAPIPACTPTVSHNTELSSASMPVSSGLADYTHMGSEDHVLCVQVSSGSEDCMGSEDHVLSAQVSSGSEDCIFCKASCCTRVFGTVPPVFPPKTVEKQGGMLVFFCISSVSKLSVFPSPLVSFSLPRAPLEPPGPPFFLDGAPGWFFYDF